MPAVVFLDANFLYVPLQFTVDVYKEIPRVMEASTILVLLSGIKAEIVLKNVSLAGTVQAKQGMAALTLATMKVREGSLRVVTEPRRDGETADDYIVRVAVSTRDRGTILDVPVRVVAVATNDKLVRAACKSVDIPVVSLRQKRYLTVS